MGTQRKIPQTAQLDLFCGRGEDQSEEMTQACPEGRFLCGDPHEIFIGDRSLEKYLIESGKGWIIRFREHLFQQDISPFLWAYKPLGRKPFHPFMMIGLILYGTQQGRWSLRELEDLARLDLGAWWICGGLPPDHSTIGDFINLHSALLTEEFFIALTSDLVKSLRLSQTMVAGDGTVVEAVSSRVSMLKQEAARQALEQAEKESGADAERTTRCRTVLETVTARNEERKRKGRGQAEARVCPDEPEAVFQPKKDGLCRPSYKPSILADRHRLILGQHVDGASEMAAVAPMLAQYQGVFGGLPSCSLWDGNYNTFEMLGLSVSLEMDCLCHVETDPTDESKDSFSKAEFRYEEKDDVYRCPAGRLLVYRKSGFLKDRPYREYQCRDCQGCAFRKDCTKSKTGRSVIRYEGEELKEAMRNVMAHPVARRRLRYRKAMVEPVFGDLVHRQGLRRFHRRGLKKVRLEFALHCMAYNLRRTVRLEQAALICFYASWYAENDQINLQKTCVVFFGAKVGIFIFARLKWKLY